jgi:type IV pilus assembly protein PilB
MGISPRLFKILEQETSKPEGMILTTGPTGSGKTTTLYAFMRKVYTPEIKIITIENPVEYHLPGIVQTQTDSKNGYTFLEGLRSALRQDPDVIMVGEIRDTETAEIAINSALTGHLVFSTLHTNNAAGTFPRLIDLGVNPKVITSALSVSMAQRLVRKLCPACRKQVLISGKTKEIIDRILGSIKNKEEYLETIPETIFEPQGCNQCNNTGYKGRIGIYEAILRSEKIEEAVQLNPSEREIWKAAEEQNILNMKQDGIVKILKGITSIKELDRVVDVESEY